MNWHNFSIVCNRVSSEPSGQNGLALQDIERVRILQLRSPSTFSRQKDVPYLLRVGSFVSELSKLGHVCC